VRWRAILLCLTAAFMLERSAVIPDDDRKMTSFKSRVGWDEVPGVEATDGVVADWSELPELLKPVLMPELRLESARVSAHERGLAQLEIDFRRRSRSVRIRIYVSSQGPALAREKLLSLVYWTNMMTIPHVRGPATLGEISLLSAHPQSSWLLWAFRNVCVDIYDDGTQTLSVADVIQTFMSQHLRPAAATFVPSVDSVEITPSPVHVADRLRVAVKPSFAAELQLDDSYREEQSELLKSHGSDAVSRTYTAEASGNASIALHLVDSKTLLVTSLRLPLEILP